MASDGPFPDIEHFYKVSIPSECLRNNVMRLHEVEEVAE
mgnify:CR=1 FL=1